MSTDISLNYMKLYESLSVFEQYERFNAIDNQL